MHIDGIISVERMIHSE